MIKFIFTVALTVVIVLGVLYLFRNCDGLDFLRPDKEKATEEFTPGSGDMYEGFTLEVPAYII